VRIRTTGISKAVMNKFINIDPFLPNKQRMRQKMILAQLMIENM